MNISTGMLSKNGKGKFRSAPAVDDLGKLKRVIKSLEFVSIPYQYLDSRNLERLCSYGKISENVYSALQEWKLQNNFTLAKGFFSEVVSLLKELEIVESRDLTEDELDNTLGIEGPTYREFIISPRTSTIQLTDIGYELCRLISNNQNEIKEYSITLFWLFLRNQNLRPIWQMLMGKREVFLDKDISVVLKQIENDSYTRNMFSKWSDYFDLYGINPTNPRLKILDRKKVSLKLLYATILELNNKYVGDDGYHVETLVTEISNQFRISPTFVNFYNILQTILELDEKKSISGSTTGRAERSLPNYNRINKLRIKSKIELFPSFSKVPDSKLISFSNVWGT